MHETREQFLAGDRPDDVLIFFSETAVERLDRLAEVGESVSGGVVLVLAAEKGRTAFQQATDVDPMSLAGSAMGVEGEIAPDCTGGDCPAVVDEGEQSAVHDPRFVFAFAEAQNEEVGDLYAEGDVIHAYALCECGTAYSQKWVAGER
jgi:hypothetical protein